MSWVVELSRQRREVNFTFHGVEQAFNRLVKSVGNKSSSSSAFDTIPVAGENHLPNVPRHY